MLEKAGESNGPEKPRQPRGSYWKAIQASLRTADGPRWDFALAGSGDWEGPQEVLTGNFQTIKSQFPFGKGPYPEEKLLEVESNLS